MRSLRYFIANPCSQEVKLNPGPNSGDGVAAPDTEDALVGFRVQRRFAGFGEFWGTIGRVPAHGARKWYRVDYDDDSEEYKLREVQRKAEYACSKAAHHPAGPPAPPPSGVWRGVVID